MGFGHGELAHQKALEKSLRTSRTRAVQVFTLGSSKIEVSETYFFDIVTTQNVKLTQNRLIENIDFKKII